MCTVLSQNNFDALLTGFLAGDEDARDTLPRVAARYVLKIARLLGPGLPEDLYSEVVNQAFLNLMRQKPGDYNPARGAAGTFLKLMVRNAVRQIRASYAPPGHVTRVRKAKGSKPPASVAAPTIVALDELQGNEAEVPVADSDIALTEARHDIEVLLRRAPKPVAVGLRRLHLHGDTMNEAAAHVGLSRFALSREISEFANQIRLAA